MTKYRQSRTTLEDVIDNDAPPRLEVGPITLPGAQNCITTNCMAVEDGNR